MNILDSGFNLMLYGMGTVFIFLSILIVTTMLMSWFINRFFKPAPISAAGSPSESPTESRQIEQNLLNILQAAVTEHKNRQ